MSTSTAFIEFLHEVFEAFGPIQAKRMFGGYGIYHDGLMFGLVVANQLYLKVDDENRSFFVAQKLEPFIYEMKGKPIELSYRLAPEAMLDERELAAVWARRSWDTALRAQATKILQTQRAKARRRSNATS